MMPNSSQGTRTLNEDGGSTGECWGRNVKVYVPNVSKIFKVSFLNNLLLQTTSPVSQFNYCPECIRLKGFWCYFKLDRHRDRQTTEMKRFIPEVSPFQTRKEHYLVELGSDFDLRCYLCKVAPLPKWEPCYTSIKATHWPLRQAAPESPNKWEPLHWSFPLIPFISE